MPRHNTRWVVRVEQGPGVVDLWGPWDTFDEADRWAAGHADLGDREVLPLADPR